MKVRVGQTVHLHNFLQRNNRMEYQKMCQYSAEELRTLLEAEEQKQQRFREQVEVRELKQKMAALKMSNEVLQEQLTKGQVGSEQPIRDNRRGISSESIVVTTCEAIKSEVNINSLRNIPEVAASAAALLNAYFRNLEGQNTALKGSVGFTQRSSTTPQTVITPSVSRAMPNRGMGGLTFVIFRIYIARRVKDSSTPWQVRVLGWFTMP